VSITSHPYLLSCMSKLFSGTAGAQSYFLFIFILNYFY
jgi:hypothetical protein